MTDDPYMFTCNGRPVLAVFAQNLPQARAYVRKAYGVGRAWGRSFRPPDYAGHYAPRNRGPDCMAVPLARDLQCSYIALVAEGAHPENLAAFRRVWHFS